LHPAVGNVDREPRVTRSVLPLLANIDESDLAALGEPSSQPRDIKGGGHRQAFPAASASIMPWCRCEDEPRAAVEFPCSQGETYFGRRQPARFGRKHYQNEWHECIRPE